VNKLVRLFRKHGYGLAEFSDEVIQFYTLVNQQEDGRIPITDWYTLPKHEFEAFVVLLQKLDDKEEDIQRYSSFVANCLR
jgi:hypothetical protein